MRSWWVVVLLVACTPQARNGVDLDGAGAPPELGSTMTAMVAGDSVRFELHITNVTSEPVSLEFASSQRYDFEVADGEGVRVWRWSDDMMFAQALGTDVLAPGESRRYGAAWRPDAAGGVVVASGRLVALNYPIELRAMVELPSW
jgi:hypothetical protein